MGLTRKELLGARFQLYRSQKLQNKHAYQHEILVLNKSSKYSLESYLAKATKCSTNY